MASSAGFAASRARTKLELRCPSRGNALILRDPVHGLIAFESEEDAIVPRLLDTAELQRLRRIKQLGVTSLAFPGAEHTRFAHALGSAHVMKRLIARLRECERDLPSWQRLDRGRAREAIAAALLHDVGHGPLSHLFEDALPDAPPHEEWTARVVLDPDSQVHRVLRAESSDLPERVADLVRGRHELRYLARAVSGTLDVDRCDYLLRDAHATGVRYGEYDLDWLLRSLRFAPVVGGEVPSLAIDGAKGLVSIEEFILARLFMFQQVYFHKATRAAEWMIRSILRRAGSLLRDGAALPSVPTALGRLALGEEPSLADYLDLDDPTLWASMHAWEQSSDPVLSDLTRRLRARALFKTVEMEPGDRAAAEDALRLARELAREASLDPDLYVGIDIAENTPFSDADDPLAVAYANGITRKPGDVSFLLGRLRGERLERIRLIFAPELRDKLLAALGS